MLFLRHAHCQGDSLSIVGLRQIDDLMAYVVNVQTIFVTEHYRPQLTLTVLKQRMQGVDIQQLTDSCAIPIVERAIFLSQQPILTREATRISGREYSPTEFRTGKLVTVMV